MLAKHEPLLPTIVDCGKCDGFGSTQSGYGFERCEQCEGQGDLILDLPPNFDSGDVDEAIERRNNQRATAQGDQR